LPNLESLRKNDWWTNLLFVLPKIDLRELLFYFLRFVCLR